jgi:beta-xylosidase
MGRLFIFLLAVIVFATIVNNSHGQEKSQYTNPVSDTIFIADPFIMQLGNQYYLYGTSAGDGFKAWVSENLVDWNPIGYIYRKKEDSWGTGNYWAPEVVNYRGKFYLTFSCKGPEKTGMRICMAIADSPEGPFEDLYMPLFNTDHSCIDAHLFIDDDQIPYLFYEMVGAVGKHWEGKGYLWGMIFSIQLSEDLSRIVSGEPTLCIYPSQDWENPESMFARSTEGMTVFKHKNLYYMTYSANHYADPQYGVGYASSESPLGLWTKSETNPILSQRPEIGVSGPGHNCIIKSPDGKELFIVYHSHFDIKNPSGKRILNIDRLEIDSTGKLKVIGPTRSPQPLPSGSGK